MIPELIRFCSLTPQQARGFQLLGNLVYRSLGVLGLSRARADELAAAEQQDDDLWHVEPVDQAGELLGPTECYLEDVI